MFKGKKLVSDTLWNIGTQVLSVLIGLLCLPYLLHGLGAERYGAISLAGTLIGYFSLFDFGLGRAILVLVAAKLGGDKQEEIPQLFWTACCMIAVASFLGAVVLIGISHPLVFRWLQIPKELRFDAWLGYLLLGATLPFLLINSAFTSFLMALGRFRESNLLRLGMNLLTWVLPILALPWVQSIPLTIGLMQVSRILGLGIAWLLCVRVYPSLRSMAIFPRSRWSELVQVGGWMTVTNVMSPLMSYFDRFIIGGVLGVSVVAWYATASDMATKLWVLPTSIALAITPALTGHLFSDPSKAQSLYKKGIQAIFMTIFPMCLIAVVAGPDLLKVWLGETSGMRVSPLFQILVVGILMNSLANIPFNVIQGSGNPKVAAIIHAVELPLYLLLIHFLIQKYGVSGAAVAWTIRVLVDAVLMNIFAAKFIDETIFSVMKRLVAQSVWTVVLCLPLFLANKMISWMTGILGLIAYLVYAGYVWNQKDKSA